MKYQKIANLLDNASNQPSKFKTKNWVKKSMNQEEHMLLINKLNLNHQS